MIELCLKAEKRYLLMRLMRTMRIVCMNETDCVDTGIYYFQFTGICYRILDEC